MKRKVTYELPVSYLHRCSRCGKVIRTHYRAEGSAYFFDSFLPLPRDEGEAMLRARDRAYLKVRLLKRDALRTALYVLGSSRDGCPFCQAKEPWQEFTEIFADSLRCDLWNLVIFISVFLYCRMRVSTALAFTAAFSFFFRPRMLLFLAVEIYMRSLCAKLYIRTCDLPWSSVPVICLDRKDLDRALKGFEVKEEALLSWDAKRVEK